MVLKTEKKLTSFLLSDMRRKKEIRNQGMEKSFESEKSKFQLTIHSYQHFFLIQKVPVLAWQIIGTTFI